jgi:formylmethanofuran dehydrogenase subunit E
VKPAAPANTADTAPYPEDFERALAFHGHLCLDIAVGYRVARTALAALAGVVDDPKALVATVGNDTCAVDAVQALTGCTFGKRNLVPRLTGKPVYVIQDAATGAGVRIYVRFWEGFDPDGTFRAAMRAAKSGKLDAEGRKAFQAEQDAQIARVLALPDAELFTLRPVHGPPPPRSGGFESEPCAACGEHVKRGLLVDGRCAECRSEMTYTD